MEESLNQGGSMSEEQSQVTYWVQRVKFEKLDIDTIQEESPMELQMDLLYHLGTQDLRRPNQQHKQLSRE